MGKESEANVGEYIALCERLLLEAEWRLIRSRQLGRESRNSEHVVSNFYESLSLLRRLDDVARRNLGYSR